MKAIVFPGQGSQAVGMGKSLADEFPAARRVFEEVDEALGENLSALIWDGDIETLTLTSNAQPALMATSMAAIAALESEGVDMSSASFVAGHSLGEYSALCAAGAFSLADTARLLRVRGRAMQDAVPAGEGAMAAIVGLPIETVVAIAAESCTVGVCEVANDNDPGQVVISGHRKAVESAAELAAGKGARRSIMLPVSAPFHCSLMSPAAEQMRLALEDANIGLASIPVVCNVDAARISTPEEIRSALIRQVTGTVRWRESVGYLYSCGVTRAWEVGAGNVLSGLIRRSERRLACSPVGNPDQVRKASEDWMEE